MSKRIKISQQRADKIRRVIDGRSQDRRPGSFREQLGNIVIRNVTDPPVTIPQYACLMPIAASYLNKIYVVDVVQWDGIYNGEFFFNSHQQIKPNEKGVAQQGKLVRAFFKTGTATGFYSPVKDEWFIVPGEGPFEALGVGKLEDELIALNPTPNEIVRFILTENCDTCDEAKANLISATGCVETEEITVIDTIGLCKLGFSGPFETFAPEGSMGFARRIAVDLYEIINIAVGCCDEDFDCPQIPGVPMGIIGVDGAGMKWVLGFDEDGCLVRAPVGDCCTEEEPEPIEEPPEGPPLEEEEEE